MDNIITNDPVKQNNQSQKSQKSFLDTITGHIKNTVNSLKNTVVDVKNTVSNSVDDVKNTVVDGSSIFNKRSS